MPWLILVPWLLREKTAPPSKVAPLFFSVNDQSQGVLPELKEWKACLVFLDFSSMLWLSRVRFAPFSRCFHNLFKTTMTTIWSIPFPNHKMRTPSLRPENIFHLLGPLKYTSLPIWHKEKLVTFRQPSKLWSQPQINRHSTSKQSVAVYSQWLSYLSR